MAGILLLKKRLLVGLLNSDSLGDSNSFYAPEFVSESLLKMNELCDLSETVSGTIAISKYKNMLFRNGMGLSTLSWDTYGLCLLAKARYKEV